MPVTILVGAQWGDEGKGRFADYFAMNATVVARYSGGDNAGHTVYVGDQVFKLHLLPSGILHEQVTCVLGNGLVINPLNLAKEIDQLIEQGLTISPSRLVISTRAHIITASHIARDASSERRLGASALGTTLRGIGPAYMDKTGRSGIRAGSMSNPQLFGQLVRQQLEQTNQWLTSEGLDLIPVDDYVQQVVAVAERLRPYLTDTTEFINQRLKNGEQILCEGAQGTLLDIDHGSYPFVTSSSPTSGGALIGLGFGPKYVDQVIGVAKAFSTRVGSGQMPTELEGDIALRLRGTGENFWDEFGTTTGRPRRCGWLDAVMLRYAVVVNGCTELAITKLDILSGIDELKIAVAYELDGQLIHFPPSTAEELERVKPIYETLHGWGEDISACRSLADLPKATQQYVRRIGELCDVPISILSVGPERDQIVKWYQ
ncbi:MAG UNVERIFIED_CONTAM: adenylosuccinate synthase [Anaerolineae bacterium]|jgi:adenylosuccinate synthase